LSSTDAARDDLPGAWLQSDRRVKRTHRIVLALLVSAVASAYVLATPMMFPAYTSDFDQLWLAARAWSAGENPYDVVLAAHRGHGLTFGLVYPFTAILVAWPLSWLPLELARVTVASLSAGCLTYLILGRAWWLFPLLLSGSFRASISLLQIAPLAACAVIVPWFGWVAAYKPNMGVAALATHRQPLAALKFLAPAIVLTLLSLALWPQWPIHWQAGVATSDFFAPLVARPGGWVLLLAALRWRRPEARWLLVVGLLPGTPRVYEALPLLVLLPRTFRQSLIFALLSHVADLGGYWMARAGGSFAVLTAAHATALLWAFYVPALAVILARPNESDDATRQTMS
jgi:hypothetical protein